MSNPTTDTPPEFDYRAAIEELVAQRDALRALVIEAYEGEPPTNAWRRKAEELDAWPGADV